MNLINFLKDIFAPKKCYLCSVEWTYLCEKCFKQIGFFEPICYVCKQKSNKFSKHFYCENDFVYYDKIIITTHYKNKTIKKFIKDSKFYNKKDLLYDMAFYMWKTLFENITDDIEDIILISTPMYFWKKVLRWYNQSELLALNISNQYKIKYYKNLIFKTKKTSPQSHLSKLERLENLKWAFNINKNLLKEVKNKTIIIVDDVVSTWTTINEISKLLKNNWAKKIYALVFASD